MGKIPHACNKNLDNIKISSKKASSLKEQFKQDQPESTLSQYLHIPIESSSHLSPKDEDMFWFKNMAINPSLSYTLNHFVTQVQIKPAKQDTYSFFRKNIFQDKQLYQSSKSISLDYRLSQKEQKKFLDFFKFLKRFFKIPGYYEVASQNNFPASVGSASSASSFSALTLAVYKLAREKSQLEKGKLEKLKPQELAHLSRIGSGSACRSLFSPLCIWDGYKIQSFYSPWNDLEHQLVIVDSKNKKISSSLAHVHVQTSPKFKNRNKTAHNRLNALKASFNLEDWKDCFQIIWDEFLDMHSLFESSDPPFSYKDKYSQHVLDWIKDFWRKNEDGPLVTMDAGPNIHFLYRKDQKKYKEEITKQLSDFTILSSR